MTTAMIETPAARFTRAYSHAVAMMSRFVLEGDDRRANKAADMARHAAQGALRYGARSPMIDWLERLLGIDEDEEA